MYNFFNKTNNRGFTLIELLIVIAVIAIISAMVFVALDPLTRFQDARDATRWQDVSSLVDAIVIDQVDNGGAYVSALESVSAGVYQLGTAGAGCDGSCSAAATVAICLDLSDLVTEGYLSSIPQDPSTGSAAETDYYLVKDAAGFVTVGACDPEGGGGAISITR